MTEGTRSYLYGCHQFFMHPLMVTLAWKRLYGRMPRPWQLGCILLHDIGHIGRDYLTYYSEKRKHWILGARIAKKLFGEKGYALVASHTGQSGFPRSELYYSDKYSWILSPIWWLRLNDKVEKFGKHRSLHVWRNLMIENFKNDCPKGSHEIYLELRGK